jgi:hypothetical protein
MSIPAFVVLLANVAVGFALVASAFTRPSPGRGAVLAALPLGMAALLTAYVFGEDSYRDNGISRWDAYTDPGGALGGMYVLSVALSLACAALVAHAARLRTRGLWKATLLAGGILDLAVLTPTIVGFNSN